MASAARGSRGSGLYGGGGGSGFRGFFSYRIFVSAMFSLLFLATLSVFFSTHPYTSSSDPVHFMINKEIEMLCRK
ncbi:hypothetical protein Dimus_023297, partial [Dionaea muscipula]